MKGWRGEHTVRLLSSWRRFWKQAPLLLGQPGSIQTGHRAGGLPRSSRPGRRGGQGAREGGAAGGAGAADTRCSGLFADAPLPEEEVLYSAEPARGVLSPGGPFHVCSPPAAPATAPLSPASLGKPDPLAILSRNATHPLLHISTLYEAREEEDGAPRAPQDVGSLITIPPPQQILIATFDEPRTVVSTVEF